MASSLHTYQRKYNAAQTLYFALVDRGTLDFESTPVTFAAGDVQISQDGSAFINTGSLPTHEGNGVYSLPLTNMELTGAIIDVTLIDQSGTKLWEDMLLHIETYGNASAQHAFDLDAAAPTVNMTEIDGQATSGNNATLNLKQLNIINSAGTAFIAASTGSNGHGINTQGDGAGHGVFFDGGATGNGFHARGGLTSGHGAVFFARTLGHGFSSTGAGADGAGILATGGELGTTSPGIRAVGGAVGGSGILAEATTADHGIEAQGVTTGSGIRSVGGASGHGIHASSGVTTGDGIRGEAGAASAGHGANFAGDLAGHGLRVVGGATGNGLSVVGGATSGDAIRATAMDGAGASFEGGLAEAGLHVIGGATGRGLHTQGGATSGAGIGSTVAVASNSDAMELISDGTGVDIDVSTGGITGDITGNLSGTVGTATALGTPAVDSIWDEDIVAAHGGADAAGRCLRTLDAVSDRTNNSNLNALLGVADSAGADVPSQTTDEVWDELLSAHVVAGSFGQASQVIRANTAAAGAAGSITLDAGASAIDAFYRNQVIHIVGGLGIDQSRIIDGYTGASKIATVSPNWVTTPDVTSIFVIRPFGEVPGATAPTAATVAAAVWDELEGSEPTVALVNNATMRATMQHLKRRFFNAVEVTSGLLTMRRDNSTTALATQVRTDDSVTQISGKQA